MKHFEDLIFQKHPFSARGIRASMYFPNGYGISVICGSEFYSNGIDTYEIAVLKEGEGICYDTPITNDVIGYLTRKEVDDIMEQIQGL